MLRLLHRSRRCSATVLATAALALALAQSTAQAQAQRGISLQWSAPAGCPAAPQITAEMDRLLGNRPARSAIPIEVSASVTREEGGGFRVHIETQKEGTTHTRDVRGASCAALGDATALILAMMIDPFLATAAPAPAPAPAAASASAPASAPAPAPAPASASAPAPAPASAPVPASVPAPVPASVPAPAGAARGAIPSSRATPSPPRTADASNAPPHVSFGLLGWMGADVGALPGVTFGFGATAVVRYGVQRFELGVGAWLDQSATLADRPSTGGDIGLIAGAAGACRDLLSGPVDLAPCVALELGSMHAEGFGVTSPEQNEAFWAALRGGGALAFAPVGRLWLVLRLEAVVPLVAPTFILGGVGQVHQPGPGGRGSLGVELGF